MTSIMAINDVVIDLYNTTWNQAYDALSSSGLLYDMEIIREALVSDDISVANAKIDSTTTDSVNEFFLNYLSSPLVRLPKDTTWTIQNEATTGDNSPIPSGSMALGVSSFTGRRESYSQSPGYSMTYGFQTKVSTAVSAISLASSETSLSTIETDLDAAISTYSSKSMTAISMGPNTMTPDMGGG